MRYERLTPEILLSDVVKGYDLRDDILSKTFGGYNVIELIDRLVELENKIEAGTLVEIPKSAVTSTSEERAVRMFAERLHEEEFCVKIGSEWVPVVKSQNIDKFIKEMYEGMKYTEILKLKEMLEKANIPFTFTDDSFGVKEKLGKNRAETALYQGLYPAYQIRLGDLADVIQHSGSYGNEQDLLEIMGGLTEEEMEYDEVLGYLSAEEVFKRFKYCWEHKTSVYKEMYEA